LTPEPRTLDTPEHVELVQFPGVPGHIAAVRHPFGEADQFTARIFNHEAEPSLVTATELFAPLLLPQFVGGSAADAVPMGFSERVDM
jgi:hypothetical protein